MLSLPWLISSCKRTCSLRDSTYPRWASSNFNRWAKVCCWSSRIQMRSWVHISLQRANDLCFHLEEISQHSHGSDILMKSSSLPKPVDVCKKFRLFRKMCLDSTYLGFKTMRQISLYLLDLEMNWTSSMLVQSDKLAIVLHLFLAPVGAVVKQAEHEVVCHQSPILGRRDAFRWVIVWCYNQLVERQGSDT